MLARLALSLLRGSTPFAIGWCDKRVHRDRRASAAQATRMVRRKGQVALYNTAEWEQWLRDLQDGENPPLPAAP